MAENYIVNYNIKVNSSGVNQALTNFQTFTQSLQTIQNSVSAFEKSFNASMRRINTMFKKSPTLDINTGRANQKLDTIIRKLTTIQKLSGSITMGTAGATTGKGNGGSTSKPAPVAAAPASASKSSSSTPKAKPGTTFAKARKVVGQRNLAYKALGPAMIDSGGIGALDMLKGMGVAYGITGLGVMMSKVLKDATEYNNIITTTRNILQTHDDRDNFNQRFAGMERVIRNVGIETKFTAPEVADASKFLAMAGFKLEDITKAIRPIADIALVGDSDLGETADVVTNIMTGYNIAPGNVRHAADIMTQTFTMSNTTLMEIAESYKYAASLLSAGGVSFEEATAGIGILGNAGIKGSQAGTTMRTIMANIVNPTKKQQGVWDSLGIKRFDEKGNLRDLVDIFTDLNAAGLSIDQIYKMFHRTAAQGAVALIKNVDEWNKIVKENFLSEGVTAELAEAKKNTIQGLWAQLTSMFTENGMKAFEGLDEQIRQMLRETIDWLHTNEAADLTKQMGHTFLDLIKMLKDFTMIIMDVYKRFGPFIKLWLELQLKISAVLIPLRIFRAMFNFGAYVVNGVRQLGMMSRQFNSLAGSVRGLTNMRGALSAMWGTMARFGGSSFGVGPVGTGAGATSFAGRSQAVIDRYTRMQKYRAQSAIGVYTGGIGGMAGAMMGGYFGSQLGEEGSTTSAIGAIGGTIAGGLAGAAIGNTVAPWLMTTAVPFLLTNPVGWGVLVAGALAGGVAAFIDYQNAVESANEANNKYLASTASINGISLSEHATQTDKYLTLVYDRQMDVNRVIGEHINLMREQLGIMDEAQKKLSDKTLGETHKDAIENAAKPFYWSLFGTAGDKRDAATAPVILPNGEVDMEMNALLSDFLDKDGHAYQMWTFNNRSFSDNVPGYQKLAAARFLYSLGRDMSEGSDLQKVQASYNKRLLMSATTDDLSAVLSDVENARIKSYLTDSKNWQMKDLESKPESEWKRSYDYVTAFNGMLDRLFNINNPMESANAQMLSDFREILTNLASGDISEELLSRFMLHSGIPIFDESKFGQFGSDAFMKQFGWYNNQWNAGAYQFFNPDTGKMETLNVTADEARQAFLLFHQQIIDLTNRLNPKVRSYFDSFLLNPIWGYGGTDNGSNGKAKLNGQEWTWNPSDQMWHGPIPFQPISNDEMQKRLRQTAGNGGGGNLGLGTGGNGHKGNGGNNGPKASDYKNHYNQGNAAPKQVIVRIGNLMNVDKIDLSNPNNAAVIASLKSELAQALVDVVHDFDETWHG